MKTIPDNWVVISIAKEGEETAYKVFASWAGGYLGGDSWRLNSGVKFAYKEDEDWRFSGYSGSHYVCNKNHYGVIGSSNRVVLDEFVQRGEKHGYTIEVLPEDYNFGLINKQINMEERLKELGFNRFYVRDIPMGFVLNKNTAESYPLRDTGSYIGEDGHTIAQGWEEGLYQLIPPSPEGKYIEKQIYNGVHTLEDIVSYLEGDNMLDKLNKVAEPLDEDAMKRWEKRVEDNEFHKVKLEDLGFTEWDRDVMGYLKITPDIELYFNKPTNTVHLNNDATGDYFGLGGVEKFEQLETLVLILKQIMK